MYKFFPDSDSEKGLNDVVIRRAKMCQIFGPSCNTNE